MLLDVLATDVVVLDGDNGKAVVEVVGAGVLELLLVVPCIPEPCISYSITGVCSISALSRPRLLSS